MPRPYRIALLLLALAIPAARSARATSPVPVSFGASWDGTANDLQHIVDARYGAGKITVTTDFVGAHVGDPDPWWWVDNSFSTYLVKEVAGNADNNTIGWYLDTGVKPTMLNDNVHDGIVFNGPATEGATAAINIPGSTAKFGFYMNPNGPYDATNAPEPELFFTNRMYNDIGRDGSGALHPPTDGDVQALIFDISGIVHKRNTWLVAFEDLDSGGVVGTETDNDYNDLVFEVTAMGITPVEFMTAGGLRLRYR